MNAADVRAALDARWPDTEYLKIREAPQDASRQGSKIDLLVISLWASRGFELDAVEIKVSLGDARLEINGSNTKHGRKGGPAKADWWFNHTHRFWMAVPEAIAAKVLEDLPDPWGLLVVKDDGKVLAKRKAPKHAAISLPMSALIGVMRASADAGFNALQRAEHRGYDRGTAEAKRDFERTTGDAVLRRKVDELTAKVAAFKAATGIDIADTYDAAEAGRLGQVTALAQRQIIARSYEIHHLEKMAGELDRVHSALASWVTDLRGLLEPAEVSVSPE